MSSPMRSRQTSWMRRSTSRSIQAVRLAPGPGSGRGTRCRRLLRASRQGFATRSPSVLNHCVVCLPTSSSAARSSSCARHCMITRRTPITGNGRREKPLFAGLELPAIAHNELAASAGFVAFDVPERDFPGNRSLPRWKFMSRPERKICAPGEGARFQRRPRHRFHLRQQRSGRARG